MREAAAAVLKVHLQPTSPTKSNSRSSVLTGNLWAAPAATATYYDCHATEHVAISMLFLYQICACCCGGAQMHRQAAFLT